MQITHEEARRLVQFNADQALKGTDKKVLEDHLAACLDCRAYADRIQELEVHLVAAMQKRWVHQPLPLHPRATGPGRRSRFGQNMVFATRIVAMTVICVAFLFNIWHFNQSAGLAPDPAPVNVHPVPTPSASSTTTMAWELECAQTLYMVGENDTLESIANRFSVSPEEILRVNRLEGDRLHPSMSLLIPICGTTPGTPGTRTTTFTPLWGPTTSTPMTGPTQ